jgi:DNA-binding transcriptional regulator WhiA
MRYTVWSHLMEPQSPMTNLNLLPMRNLNLTFENFNVNSDAPESPMTNLTLLPDSTTISTLISLISSYSNLILFESLSFIRNLTAATISPLRKL